MYMYKYDAVSIHFLCAMFRSRAGIRPTRPVTKSCLDSPCPWTPTTPTSCLWMTAFAENIREWLTSALTWRVDWQVRAGVKVCLYVFLSFRSRWSGPWFIVSRWLICVWLPLLQCCLLHLDVMSCLCCLCAYIMCSVGLFLHSSIVVLNRAAMWR